jgi:hypothetical protein
VNLAPASANRTRRTLLPILLPHLQRGQHLGLLTDLLGVSDIHIAFLVDHFILHDKPRTSRLPCYLIWSQTHPLRWCLVVPPPVRTLLLLPESGAPSPNPPLSCSPLRSSACRGAPGHGRERNHGGRRQAHSRSSLVHVVLRGHQKEGSHFNFILSNT